MAGRRGGRQDLLPDHCSLSTVQQAPPAARHALPALTLDTLPITAPSAAYLHHQPRGSWLPWGNVARRVNLGIKGAGLEVPRESKEAGGALLLELLAQTLHSKALWCCPEAAA